MRPRRRPLPIIVPLVLLIATAVLASADFDPPTRTAARALPLQDVTFAETAP